MISPFILRRIKSQVLDELPPRTDVILEVEMGREEKAFYEALKVEIDLIISEVKMPIVSIRIAKGRSKEQKRKLVKAITDSVVSTLDVKPEWVSVLIEEFDRENWSTGGELHIDKFGSSYGREGKK